jgi:hypothetical protein
MKTKKRGYTVPMKELTLDLFTPSQRRQIREGNVSERMKRYWIVQNKARTETGKPYVTRAELRAAEDALNRADSGK